MATANPGATAVVYARVSSKDQEREGFSIPAQLKLLRTYALEHRLTILQEFVDVETAKQAGRGGFGEMLAFLKANPSCRTMLVEKTDRLYRNIRDWITVDDRDLTSTSSKRTSQRAFSRPIPRRPIERRRASGIAERSGPTTAR